MGLKLADASKRKRYEREGDDAWIELRTAFSKRDDAIINDSTGFDRISVPEGLILRGRATTGDPVVFDLLAVGWSLAEGKPKREDYEALDAADAGWIDQCLSDAVSIARGEIEGKGISLAKGDPPSDGQPSSPAVDDQPSTD
jgi:hypothetical protein